MSIFGVFRKAFSDSATGVQTAVIDASALYAAQSGNSRPRPPDQVSLLKRLSEYRAKEELKLIAVFDSRPLRESPNGEDFREVTTYYTTQNEEMDQLMMRIFRKYGPKVIVVTANEAIETQVKRAGAQVMSPVTFKKALDGGVGKQRQSSSNRRPRRRGSRDEKPAKAQAAHSEDPILDMIDPI